MDNEIKEKYDSVYTPNVDNKRYCVYTIVLFNLINHNLKNTSTEKMW